MCNILWLPRTIKAANFSVDNSGEKDKHSMLLQHIEFEVYVNKHHIWLFEKRNRCETKCGYHTMTKLYIIYYRLLSNFFRKFNFYKEQLYNILNIYNIYI